MATPEEKLLNWAREREANPPSPSVPKPPLGQAKDVLMHFLGGSIGSRKVTLSEGKPTSKTADELRTELKEALGEFDTTTLPEDRARQYQQIVGELDGNLDDLTHLNLIVKHYHNFAADRPLDAPEIKKVRRKQK